MGTKIRISGLPGHIEWMAIKDFCSQAGSIVYCDVEKDDGTIVPPPGGLLPPRVPVPPPDASALAPKAARIIAPGAPAAVGQPDPTGALGGVPHLDLSGGLGGLA